MARIIVVTSGKGGVGKTTTSASFASGLALRGRRRRIVIAPGTAGGRGLLGWYAADVEPEPGALHRHRPRRVAPVRAQVGDDLVLFRARRNWNWNLPKLIKI